MSSGNGDGIRAQGSGWPKWVPEDEPVSAVMPPVNLSINQIDDLEKSRAATAHSKADESQVGGKHYKTLSIQPWAAMESWMSAEAFEGFLRGNVIKYISRYPQKNGGRRPQEVKALPRQTD